MPDSRLPLILCVDADPAALDALAELLDGSGFRVRTTTDAEGALAVIAEDRPELVVLDGALGEAVGDVIAFELRHGGSMGEVPILWTANAAARHDDDVAVATEDRIVKPFDDDAVLACVRRHLRADRREAPAHDAAGGPADFGTFKRILATRLLEHGADEGCTTLRAADLYEYAAARQVPEEILAGWIAEYTGHPLVMDIDPGSVALDVLPLQFCRANDVAVIDGVDGLGFILSNPFDWETLEILRAHAEPGGQPRLHLATPRVVRRALQRAVPMKIEMRPEPDGAAEIAPRTRARARKVLAQADVSFEVEPGNEAPAIEKANAVLAEGVRMRASDIHLEPQEHEVGVRYRIDGMLVPQDPIPKAMQASVISRIKIMARMDIAERRVPQDGRVRLVFEGRAIDLRISTLPTRHGEKIVVRILDKSALDLDLAALGFEPETLQGLHESVRRPHGILLVTGPTGSGKTTTLYSALKELNHPHANIVTVEDPIEFELPQVNQVQVHPVAGLTFPAALRSILRQDPDIIMIGEVRDSETLDIAMKAALTGHLVLSTLHTNDAVSTISRLIDMGAEPFLVASTVAMISGQRLLRRLCESCKRPAEIAPAVRDRLDVDPEATFFAPAGCVRCNGIGYRGRMAVAEVLLLDEAWRQLISRSADLATLRQHARSVGMVTMRQNALRKVHRGLTSIEEVLRVTT